MKSATKLLTTAIAAISISGLAQAENGWSADAELGYVLTTGNTDTETTNAKFGVQNTADKLVSALKLEALTGKSEKVTNKEKYNAELKFDYNLTEVSYLTGLLTYENDRFNGFEYQSTYSLGYGHKILNNDVTKLSVEAGPGHRRDEVKETSEIVEETIGRFALDFSWKLSENAEFTELFTIEAGEDNQIYKSEAALKSTLVGDLAMKLSHTAKYIQEVPEGSKRRDDTVGVTLVYSF